MVNYQLGKIYKIVCNTTGLIYIGSTCEPTLARRLSGHNRHYQCYKTGKSTFITSFHILENGAYEIILIENYPCNSKDELHAQERFHIETNECVNKTIPTQTKPEYRELNKVKIIKNRKEYYLANADNIKSNAKIDYELNRERNLQNKKIYYEANKDSILQKVKDYKDKNREDHNRKRREDYDAKKEKMNERRRELAKQKKNKV
jgi:hypothetical protein